MPEIILPCPNCRTDLLVDEGNAGRDVLCPGCEVRLTLPEDLSGQTLPVVAGSLPAAASAATDADGGKRNYPLHRTGHLSPVADEEGHVPDVPARHTHLPNKGRRELDAPEELRRLASMAAVPASFDLHNVDTKGRVAFPCPGCHRPLWMLPSDAGDVLTCQGCAREVIAPDPAHQQAARLADDSSEAAPRQKTVLPARRQVENLPLGEQAAAGRPKRQSGQMPQARESIRGPLPTPAERARTPAPAQEPIPARGDVDMAATVYRGPAAPRRATLVTPAQESAAIASEFESNAPALPADATGIPGARHFQRQAAERIPNFTPKHEVDLSVENTGQWGSEGKPENSAGFRRTLTTAIIILLIGGVCIAAYFLKSSWSPVENATTPEETENPVAGVEGARETIEGFFTDPDPAGMAKFIRHPEKTLPRLEKYYRNPSNALSREGFSSEAFTDDWRELDNYRESGVNFITTSLKLPGGQSRTVFLEVPKDGSRPLLDWEHFIGWSDASWEDFLRTTSERPTEFRVSVTPYSYYNYAYSDEHRYLSFKVTDPANSAHCYAYCEAGTKLANMLLDAVREGRQAGRIDRSSGDGIAEVIITLHFRPEGKQYNQAVIDELVWNDWLRPLDP